MHYNHIILNGKRKEQFNTIKEAVMKKLKRHLRILLITRISTWLEYGFEYGLSDDVWAACSCYLAQLKQELTAE